MKLHYQEENLQDAIVAINGKSPDHYLKRAIDENGSLAYYPYAMIEQKENTVKYLVEYQSGSTKNIRLTPAEYSNDKVPDRLYGYDKYDHLAYVEMNQAYMKWETPKIRRKFLKDTADMKKQKCIIFDLRNNTGGDGSLIEEWFEEFTGHTLIPNYSTLRIRPVWIGDAKEVKEMDDFAAQPGLKKRGKYYYDQYPSHQFLKNKNQQIFVLTSRLTSSAAEAMTDALRNLLQGLYSRSLQFFFFTDMVSSPNTYFRVERCSETSRKIINGQLDCYSKN